MLFVLRTKFHTDFDVASFNFVVDGFTDVMKKAGTSCERDVFTKFRESGKDRAEMQAFIASELKFTDDQKKGREELTALTAEITKEVEAVLTAEQKTKLAELRSQRGRRPGGEAGKRPERKKD